MILAGNKRRAGAAVAAAGMDGLRMLQFSYALGHGRQETSVKHIGAGVFGAFFNRGLGAAKSGDFDRAIQNYNRAIDLNPNHARSFNARGYAHDRKGDLARALADYDRAIELDPSFVPALSNRALARLKKGETKNAIADANAALRLDSKYAPAYRTRGMARARNGQSNEALADLKEAIRLAPRDAASFFNRGLLHDKRGDRAHALSDFRAALALEPKHQDAAVWRTKLSAASKPPAKPQTERKAEIPQPHPRPPIGNVSAKTPTTPAASNAFAGAPRPKTNTPDATLNNY